MNEIQNLLSKLNLDCENLDDVVARMDAEEFEKFTEICLIWPNIPQVVENLRLTKVFAKGQNWIAIEFPKPKSAADIELNSIFEYLESTDAGAPVFDFDLNISEYK